MLMIVTAITRGAFIVAAAAMLAACGQNNRYVAPPPPKVVVARPVQKPVTLYLNLTGNTAAFNCGESGRARPGLSDIDRL
jgi:multidrug efflux system membrane fusion protein